MKRMMPLAAAVLLVFSCQSGHDLKSGTDPVISDALAEVSIDSVRMYIDDLVSLHTRHTLSSQTDPERGLGAARGSAADGPKAPLQAARSHPQKGSITRLVKTEDAMTESFPFLN